MTTEAESTTFDLLLRHIIARAGAQPATARSKSNGGSELRTYFIGGGWELAGGITPTARARIEPGGIEALFAIEWREVNQASIIESGLHLFLTRQAAAHWRDGHESDAYR
ncbi:MAG: hypothetical protein QGF53_03375, partial [Alphaproteobacteria bacterium]|nr:hypothetical protein [Alphaproteobacteria bacterium]